MRKIIRIQIKSNNKQNIKLESRNVYNSRFDNDLDKKFVLIMLTDIQL